MPVKIIVLYPQPTDAQAFEHAYHGEHMPLMRSLIAPDARTPTFRVVGPPGAPFYRSAEVHFPDLAAVQSFATSEGGKRARLSSERVSTGGVPIVIVCEAD